MLTTHRVRTEEVLDFGRRAVRLMHRFFEAVIAPALQALRPKVIVEIGALAGAMTNKLIDYGIEHGAVVHSIDPEPQLERREVASFVLHRALSHDALPGISRIDVALIDGDHNYHTVLGELQILAANAKRDSHPFPVVILHDVDWPYGRRDSYWDPLTVPIESQQPSSRKGMRPGQSKLVEDGGGLNSQFFNADHEGGARNGVRTAVEDFISTAPMELIYVHLPALHGLGILCPASRRRDLALVIESLELSPSLESVIASTEAERVHYQIRSQELSGRFVSSGPDLSIVVVMYNMSREAERTLHSLSRTYQQRVADLDYEVVVVDNGSEEPLNAEWVSSHGPEFSYLRLPKKGMSPAPAVNVGVATSKGRLVGIMIDGARILSPGALAEAIEASRVSANSIVATLAWHLGPEIQRHSKSQRYDQDVEDRLLKDVRWPEDGYRLFDISVFAGSSKEGHFGPLAESNFVVMNRALFDEIGGMNEGFETPGGGLVNLDFYTRAVTTPGTKLLLLLGEGSFHQRHGGAMTGGGASPPLTFSELKDEYRRLFGVDWKPNSVRPTYYGMLHPKALRSLALSIAETAVDINRLYTPNVD